MAYFTKRPQIIERNQQSFRRAVKRNQEKIFKGKEKKEMFTLKEGPRYMYFSLKYFARLGIIDYEMISRLRKGAKMLSIGVGLATMEKTLLAFSIPPENIDVADITIHQRAEKTPFRKFVFDMTEPTSWPSFGRKYDYIVFPESLSVAAGLWAISRYGLAERKIAQNYSSRFRTIINKILNNKSQEAENTAFLTKFKTKLPRADKVIEIILTALKKLNAGGEIRISKHHLTPIELAYVVLSISRLPKTLVYRPNEIVMIIKRA